MPPRERPRKQVAVTLRPPFQRALPAPRNDDVARDSYWPPVTVFRGPLAALNQCVRFMA